MLPLGDENPIRSKPVMNWTIIAICILVFIWQNVGGFFQFRESILKFGLVPSRISEGSGYHTVITNMFLHGGWFHLGGNMLFLWIFGDNIEDSYGHLRFLIFYLFCGVISSFFWLLTAWGSSRPAVGASGAISGILGAYIVLHPRARIRTLISMGFFIRIARIPAFIVIGLWFVYQFLLALVPVNTGIAYWSHIGGFIAGLILARSIKPREPSPDWYIRDYYS